MSDQEIGKIPVDDAQAALRFCQALAGAVHSSNQEMLPTPPSPSISVVIPVFNAAESLGLLAARLKEVFSTMGRSAEIVFVDDCSRDQSWQVLKKLKQEYGKFVKIARLLVNSGQHNAILCGLYLSKGEMVITMDDDLQNPPEEIPKLIEAVERGYDLVVGAYEVKQHSHLRNRGGKVVDGALRLIFGLRRDFQLTSFRAAKRVVVDNVCQMSGVFPYITAMMFSNASNYTNVTVRHDPRPFGRSNYNLKRSLLLAANLVFNYSPYPLYAISLLSLLAFLLSVVFGLFTIYRVLLYGSSVPGWASTIVIVSFFNALTMFCLVVFGVYLSRISQQLTRSKVSYTISELYE